MALICGLAAPRIAIVRYLRGAPIDAESLGCIGLFRIISFPTDLHAGLSPVQKCCIKLQRIQWVSELAIYPIYVTHFEDVLSRSYKLLLLICVCSGHQNACTYVLGSYTTVLLCLQSPTVRLNIPLALYASAD